MKHITQILIDNGYETFRYVYKDKQWSLIPCEFTNFYSGAVPGCIDYRFIKDGNEVIFGLHENGKPPTLIHPRPKGMTDDRMNRLLQQDSFKVFKEWIT